VSRAGGDARPRRLTVPPAPRSPSAMTVARLVMHNQVPMIPCIDDERASSPLLLLLLLLLSGC